MGTPWDLKGGVGWGWRGELSLSQPVGPCDHAARAEGIVRAVRAVHTTPHAIPPPDRLGRGACCRTGRRPPQGVEGAQVLSVDPRLPSPPFGHMLATQGSSGDCDDHAFTELLVDAVLG